MKKQLTLIALLSLASNQSFANQNIETSIEKENSFFSDNYTLELKFGGWSNHDSHEPIHMDAPLNENHKGFGIEYYREINQYPNHYLGTGAWYMKDSFGNPSYQLSVAYKYRWNIDYIIDSIDFNMNIGVVNRTYRSFHFNYIQQPDGSYEKALKNYWEERDTKLTTMPMITFNVLDHLQADIVWYPEFIAKQMNDYSLVFFRFGYQF